MKGMKFLHEIFLKINSSVVNMHCCSFITKKEESIFELEQIEFFKIQWLSKNKGRWDKIEF